MRKQHKQTHQSKTLLFALKFILLFVCISSLCPLINGQTSSSVWTDVNPSDIPLARDRWITNDKFRAVKTDVKVLKELLKNAPMEFTPEAKTQAILFEIPTPDGRIQHFKIVESPIMMPGLAAKYPEIKTYAGKCVENPEAKVRFCLTPNGFVAMVMSTKGTYLIDPFYKGNIEYYICYYLKDFYDYNISVSCCTLGLKQDFCTNPDKIILSESKKLNNKAEQTNECQLHVYRLALAATYEYTQAPDHIGKVMSDMCETIMKVNMIFENDLGILLKIIPENEAIIFDKPIGDDYVFPIKLGDNQNEIDKNLIVVDTKLNNYQKKIDDLITTCAYDIGHIFTNISYGKTSDWNETCDPFKKAKGVSGGWVSDKDGNFSYYPINAFLTATHEIGHQFGAHHTLSQSCGAENKEIYGVEPGGGSTIMAYPGRCQGIDDIFNKSTNPLSPDLVEKELLYFHGESISQIKTFLLNKGGTCGNNQVTFPCSSPQITIPVNNNKNSPSVSIFTKPNQNIPKSTPFFLNATGTDPEKNNLTYCWEQMDPFINKSLSPQPPEEGKNAGPVFRSYPPIENGTRYFPRLKDLVNTVNNTWPTWEVLPKVKRDLKFRVTARDNDNVCGCTDYKDITISVDNKSGPFKVISPNDNASFTGGSSITVKWDVAGTNTGLVSCNKVDLLIMLTNPDIPEYYDFPAFYSLGDAENTLDQDGKYASKKVTLPNIETTHARIMIRGQDRAFFDISDKDFTIYKSSKPSIVCQENMTVSCASKVPVPNTGSVSASANCGIGPPIVTFVSDVTTSGSCPNKFSITRTYKVKDVCGNTATCSQIITVNDIDAPIFTTCPGPLNISKGSTVPIPNPGSVIASDNCGGLIPVIFLSDVKTNQTDANNYTLIRTYKATDACNNSATCVQIISVNDNDCQLGPMTQNKENFKSSGAYGEYNYWRAYNLINSKCFNLMAVTIPAACSGQVQIFVYIYNGPLPSSSLYLQNAYLIGQSNIVNLKSTTSNDGLVKIPLNDKTFIPAGSKFLVELRTISFEYCDGVIGSNNHGSTVAPYASDQSNFSDPSQLLYTDLNGDYDIVQILNSDISPCTNISILTQPKNQTVKFGMGTTLNFEAIGTEPFTCQWFKNSIPIVSEASKLYYQTPVFNKGDKPTKYYCKITNCAGSKNTDEITLSGTSTCKPITIVKQPKTQTAKLHEQIIFNVVVDGTGPFNYQWYRNNVKLDLETKSIMYEFHIIPGIYTYYCAISNCAGKTIMSDNATLTILNSNISGKNESTYSQNATQFEKSNILVRNESTDQIINSNKLIVFPNPNNGEFTLKLESYLGESIKIIIYNEYNQEVYSNQEYSTENTYTKLISLNENNPGIYIVRVITPLDNIINKVLLAK